MDYSEVKHRIIRNLPDDFLQDDKNREALELMEKAIEKQVSKKAAKLNYKLLIDDGWIYQCPNCGCACGVNKFHRDVTIDNTCCTQCGQALIF